MLSAENRLVIWRHQLIGERNPLSENAMGMDPEGKTWKTKDYILQASKQEVDNEGHHTFYLKGTPQPGDLIITLAGRPQTRRAAEQAPRTGYYRVLSCDTRRAPNGRIIYTKVRTKAERTGQWHEYL